MIFQHFLKFLKNRSNEDPLWRDASDFTIYVPKYLRKDPKVII